MPTSGDLALANELIDSYDAESPLVRLAELTSPACRIEPQLLRRIRMACFSETAAQLEQDLWFCDLVASRTDGAITFAHDVTHALRDRLKQRLPNQEPMIQRARDITAHFHGTLPAVLLLEDQIAWASVFDEQAEIDRLVKTLFESLRLRRDGLDHWLGRAWPVLPEQIATTREGPALAQVAASRGAEVEVDKVPESSQLRPLIHLFESADLFLSRVGLYLDLNAPPERATHVIKVPATQPWAVQLQFLHGGKKVKESIQIDPRQVRRVEVGDVTVTIETLAGDSYRLKPAKKAEQFVIEMLPAGNGASLLLTYGESHRAHQVLVDGGTKATGRRLADRFAQMPPEERVLELLVVTHYDADRIGGIIELLKNSKTSPQIKDIWFNNPDPDAELGLL